ncbi:MAG: prenyltransferase/squalene oxidase repeat-containing protein [Phycisphaeraceae bacterium]
MKLHQQLVALLLLICVCLPATGLDDEHWKKANASIEKGIAYLRASQGDDGSWMPDLGPAVTGLALTALLEQPNIGPDDPAAAKAIAYILKHVQDDGSIRKGPDGILASYNTALSLSALARIGGSNPEAASAIKGGQAFLKGTQWLTGMKDPDGKTIEEGHPYFGGFGYGGSGRPDISNTQLALQALKDTGVDCEDPVFKRALTFLNRIQAVESNDMHADKFEELDGGFIYSTSINKDHIGVAESKASQDQIDEAKAGRAVSGLRTYGSVTYAGFKSMIYANLDRDDPRMVAAMGWISKNYDLNRNPGMPEEQKLQGLFYYYITKARALNAYGNTSISVQRPGVDGGDPTVEKRDWANDLIATVVKHQHEEGWWANTETRWLESQPALVTAYAVIALQNAID